MKGHLVLRSSFLLQHKSKASPCCPGFWSSSCHWNSTHRNQFYSCPPQEAQPGHRLGLSLVKLWKSWKCQDLVTKRTESSCWSLEHKSPVEINIPKASYWNFWSHLESVTLGSWKPTEPTWGPTEIPSKTSWLYVQKIIKQLIGQLGSMCLRI